MLRRQPKHILVYPIRNYYIIHQETILTHPVSQSSFKVILRINSSYYLANTEFSLGIKVRKKAIRSLEHFPVYTELFYTL